MLKTIKGSYIAASVVYIIIGIVLLLFPEMSLKVVCGIFGTVILLFGLLRIFSYIRNRDVGFIGQFELALGIVFSVIGGFLLWKPGVILSILPIVIGIYIIFDSLQNFKQALDLYKVSYDKWWLMLILSMILALLGVIIVLNPFETVEVSVMFIGGIFVFDGISNIISILFTNRKIKQLTAVAVIDVEPEELKEVE